MDALWALMRWWFWLTVIGWAAFPLAWWFFRPLGDRGFSLSKPLGLLIWGYLFWLGNTFGFLHNTFGGALSALVVLAVLSYASTRSDWRENEEGERPFVRWVRQHFRSLLLTEGVFLVAYLGWAYVRAHSPDIATAGGEKFMEIAFINGILTSSRFPPHDPWLAGYAISYYYFGYVLIAGLVHLSGVASSVGFNLAGATWFALSFTGAYGLVGNWVARLVKGPRSSSFVPGWGLIGGVVLALIGNLEGFLEVLYARQVLPVSFWQWLDIRNINGPYNPAQAPSWIPSRFIWWWQASRVIHDKDLLGNTMEVIDEFPAFSFILGDMHPHVLALPFVLLSIAGALSLFWWRVGIPGEGHESSEQEMNGARWERVYGYFRQFQALAQAHSLTWPRFVLYALMLGALAFLNTWDFPIYLLLFMGVVAVRMGKNRLTWASVPPALTLGGGIALLGILLYFPFYLGFQSQAGGILPNLFNPTRFPQFFVMFGPLLVLLVVFGYMIGRREGVRYGDLLRWILAVWVLPWLLLATLIGLYLVTPAGRAFLDQILARPEVQSNMGGRSLGQLALLIGEIRLRHPGTFLILGAFLGWALYQLSRSPADGEHESPPADSQFGVLLLTLGLGLTYAVEFVYLKDLFGTRMNTVFKFYFQAWVLWALVGVYGLAWAFGYLRGHRRVGIVGMAVLFLALGGVYTALAIPARSQLQQAGVTLDGEAWVARHFPDDEAGIRWVRAHVPGDATLVEATGGSYSFFGRISAFSGRPTLLGWDFHELQWRGAALSRQAGSRSQDIERIYKQERGAALLELLHAYNVQYVVLGSQERQKYGLSQARERVFDHVLDVVFEQGTMRIYRVP